jgi:hypothetical protein
MQRFNDLCLFHVHPFFLSSSKVIIDALRGVLSVELDTADGVAPDREDIFARSQTETFFFGSDLVFIFARLAWFFAFARNFALWCFFITLFCLLLAMFTPACSCL